MRSHRTYLASILAFALVLTSLGMAMSRGAMAAEGHLCAETRPAPIVLAHDGLPLMAPDGEVVTLDQPVCLDCLVGALALGSFAAHEMPLLALCDAIYACDHPDAVASRWSMGGQGRGPPPAA